jgi:glycine cleavage system H protein
VSWIAWIVGSSPVAGQVVEVNEALKTQPELVNQDPYGSGWMIRVTVTDAGGDLLDAAAYRALVEQS